MMSYLGEWIKHIILLILMASFLDLLLPNSSMRKYVKLVVGFLLILLILSPVLHLFQFEYDRVMASLDELIQHREKKAERQLEEEKQRIEQLQEEAVIEEVSENWAKEIQQHLEDQLAVRVLDIGFQLDYVQEQIVVNQVHLSLETLPYPAHEAAPVRGNTQEEHVTGTESQAHDGAGEEGVQRSNPTIESIDPIQPVVVRIKEHKAPVASPPEHAEEKKLQKSVLKLVQTEWNISEDKIQIAWSRR